MTLLPPIAARRVLRAERRGSSAPVVVATDAGRWLVKLRGAAQGTGALVAEIIVAELAERLDLRVPARRIVTLAPEVPSDDRNDELADLLGWSTGENLGFSFLEPARGLRAEDLERADPGLLARIRWLDWLVLNPDRTAANPNILVSGRTWWLVDHGAALSFQYDWARVTEESPARVMAGPPHLLTSAVPDVAEWDALLTATVGRADLEAAVAQVPASFLAPLLPPPATPEALARRRAAYVAFLWKRLHSPRPRAGIPDRPVPTITEPPPPSQVTAR